MTNYLANLEAILDKCRRGDRNGQRMLYEHFYGYGMNIALRYAHNKEEATEILNDGFLKTFNNLDKYQPIFPFKPWFRKIIINAAIDYHRKHHKLNAFFQLEMVEENCRTSFSTTQIIACR